MKIDSLNGKARLDIKKTENICIPVSSHFTTAPSTICLSVFGKTQLFDALFRFVKSLNFGKNLRWPHTGDQLPFRAKIFGWSSPLRS